MILNNSVELKKIDDYTFTFTGSFSHLVDKIKYANIEGETYSKLYRDEVFVDVDKEVKENPQVNEIELDFNIKLKIIELKNYRLSHLLANESTVEDINLLKNLYRKKMLPKHIDCVYTSESNNVYLKNFKDSLNDLLVPVEQFSYGWNNSLYIDYNLHFVLNQNYNSWPFNVKRLFRECGYDFSKKETFKESLKLLQRILDNKTSKKRKILTA